MDLLGYTRRKTHEVQVGTIPLGGANPVRVQSMATYPTVDTANCVEQAIRIIEAGGEYVRFTTQGTREAENMQHISRALRARGYCQPLVADVHFNPRVAEVAAAYVEKVRINPGNYTDAARTFKQLSFTDEEYAVELEKIRTRLVPLLNLCKAHGTVLRIGVNHGSLSDRIMSRYGDTPQGMVESCMEFLRICVEQQFLRVVISIKASNTLVMVSTVRLLVQAMEREHMDFPLHLGVTEAGEGEDGRIRSAVGIGCLLLDGIGDTIRVSLSEAPEAEIPVAKQLVQYCTTRRVGAVPAVRVPETYNWANPLRRQSNEVRGVGGHALPQVFTQVPTQDTVVVSASDLDEARLAEIKRHPEWILVSKPVSGNHLGEHRAVAFQLMDAGIRNPLLVAESYEESSLEAFQLKAAADCGILFLDGLADGLVLQNAGSRLSIQDVEHTGYAILQAARVRFTKVDYISCPGCGRTLFNLQSAIARVKEATSHLSGLKIAIMGCIVNGPGEMADADYGYVGAGRGKVSLYCGKECVRKNIPEDEAVEQLLQLIAQRRP